MAKRVGLRILFAAILILLPLELLAMRALGGEPYPAAFLPNFGSVPQQGNSISFVSTSITGTTVEGENVSIDAIELMPNQTKLAESIANSFFSDEDRVASAAASGWFTDRLAVLFPDHRFASLEVERARTLVDKSTREATGSEVLTTYSVELLSKPETAE